MKKTLKIFGITASILFVLGIVFMITGIILCHGKLSFERTESIFRNMFHISEDSFSDDLSITSDVDSQQLEYDCKSIKNLDVDLEYGNIMIQENDTDTIRVTVNQIEDEISIEQNGTTLQIKTVSQKWWKNTTDAVLIEIPSGISFQNIKINGSAGDVDLDVPLKADTINFFIGAGEFDVSDITAKDFQCEVGAGEMSLDQFEIETVKIDCGIGEIHLTGNLLGNADVDCGVGEVDMELNGNAKDYDYHLKCSVGSIDVGEASFTGSVKKDIDNESDKKIAIDCGTGEVNVEFY